MLPPRSLFSRPSSHFLSNIDRSCAIAPLTPSHLPSILSLTLSFAAPSTTRSGISNLHQSSATHPSTSLSSLRHSRLPAHSALSHSRSTHPSSGDRSLQPPATSSYPPSTTAPTNANRPLSSTSPSTSSMIVSGLSFYDPTQASVVPQYQHLSRWDAPFAPSLSDAIDNSITSRDPAFIAGNNPDSASGSGGDFQFIRSAAGFDFHRANDPSGGGPQLPSHPQQQHRQIVPIPRRQRGPPHHDSTNVQGQGQVERREQRRVEGQVSNLYPCILHLLQLWRVLLVMSRLKNGAQPPKRSRTNGCKSY